MTRVTDNMIFASLRRDVGRAQLDNYRAHLRASTGRRVQTASDDPVAAVRAQVFQSGLARLEAMDRTAGRAELIATTTETALGHALELLDQAHGIAVAGAAEPASAEDRANAGAVVDQVRDTMLAVANTEIDGEHVFGGFRVATPPFLADGSFVGDANLREVEVAPEVRATMNVSGADAFTAAGGEDILALLQSLRDDLLANDPIAVRSRLSALDAAREQLVRAHAGASLNLRIIQESAAARRALRETFLDARSAAIEVDQTEAYVELLETQNALEASTTVAARILDSLRGPLRF